MRLLLDTHALLWWLAGNTALPKTARLAIDAEDAEVLVSAASAMEVTTKFRLGKLPEAADLAPDFMGTVTRHGFQMLSVTVEHAALAGALAIPHKDPFDRLLIAQAQIEQLLFVSNEALFDGFGVRRLW